MRVLVTGGAGFIGSHLVDALAERGDEVLAFDDLSSGKRENLERAFARDAELTEGDVTDAEAVSTAVSDHRPETIFHLAAQIDVRRSVEDPRFDLDINVGGTLNVLAAALDASVGRVIFISTGGAIYGEGEGRDLPLAEDAECRPDAPYGQAKLAAEGYVSLYGRLHGLSTAALRLGNVYGPRQDPLGEAGVVAIFSRLLLDAGQPRVFGDGLQTRDYVFAGDVVSACLAAVGSEATGAFNIGTGQETSVMELGERMAAITGREFEPEMAPARLGEVQRISIDSARAQRELGWAPSVDLDQGLELTVDSFRS
jgi:UDP-glucose 4-epimerase